MTDQSEEYKVGYGKPPVNRQFGQPGGNIPGATTETRKAWLAAGEKSAKLYLDMVESLEGKIAEMRDDPENPDQFAAVNAVKSDILRLLKDVQDRAFGAPTQPVENTSPDGSMSPRTINIVAAGKSQP